MARNRSRLEDKGSCLVDIDGFTLIELMIVVVIVAILAAIAYPNYIEQVRKTRRSDAQAALMTVGQALERCYTEYNAYNHTNCALIDSSGSALASQYATTGEQYYTLSLDTLDSSTFILRATPIGDQINDKCGYLTYDHVGRKGVEKDVNGDGTAGDIEDVRSCW